MKFTEVRTLEHLLKEVGTQGTQGTRGTQGTQSTVQQLSKPKQQTVKDIKKGSIIVGKDKKNKVVISPVGDGDIPDAMVVQGDDGEYEVVDQNQNIDAFDPEELKGDPAGAKDLLKGFSDKVTKSFSKGLEFGKFLTAGKLSKIAKKKNKKIKIKNLKSKIKKLSRKGLKEADANLFEINFNRRSVAKEALDAPVNCGFEAETFFYGVDGRGASDDVDNMNIGDIEYEFGDLPDQAYEDYRDWLYQKGQDEYLEDLIDEKVEEFREDEDYLNDFIDSSSGPSSEAIDVYKKDFEESDPDEFENREEDGWEYINWVREFVEEEYEAEYLDWLRDAIQEEFDLDDEATEAAEGDYSMDEWVYDQWSYMSSFLDDYGYEYSRPGGNVEEVADLLHGWAKNESEFKDYPEHGDYGDTYTTTAWAVETDSSIDPDEGAGAEIISPVFSSPRQMLTEMKSLFEWGEDEFGTNNSTGLHVTMSWQGEKRDPFKLKMALLLGDQYLLKEFDRINNSYTKSQYKNILRAAENMKRGGKNSFKDFENELSKHISGDKFQTVHFKNTNDNTSGNELIEFRIAGGSDYQNDYEKIVKAVVRYATIMKAGYEADSFKKDYIDAVFRVMRKSTELDPKRVKDLEDRDDIASHPVIDSAKNIVGKKDYFDVVSLLSNSLNAFIDYENFSQPSADKEWKQSIKDYRKGTGSDPSWMGESLNEVEQGEPITGYIEPDRLAPSKRAKQRLQSAQTKFGSALAMLARDIADGKNRGPVKAKDIGAFRSYAKQLKLDDTALEKLAIEKMDDQNFGGTDKDNIARLKKGIDTLFKKNVINEPEYFKPQQLDIIAGKMWQFYQSDDSKDNLKLDKLGQLLSNLNPRIDKDDIFRVLDELSQERAQNGFVAKMRGSGWNTPASILSSGRITSPDAAKELIKFLSPYKGYKHPTGKEHHVNIKSDERYEEVAKSALVQKMRFRLDHLVNLEEEDNEKYLKIKSKLIKIGNTLVDTIVEPEEETGIEFGDITDKDGTDISGFVKDQYGGEGPWCLSIDRGEMNRVKDFLVKAEDNDDVSYNFTTAYDDYVIRNPLGMLTTYYKSKENFPNIHKHPEIKKIVKKNFAAIKKYLTEFDKIFTAEGFMDLKAEISDKDRYDKRNKDFEKNIRSNAKSKFNIPSHSWVYFKKDFWETITDKDYDDREAYLDNHLESFNDNLNKDGKVYVIPASHWSDADDAVSGLSLIDTYENAKNYFHTWRKTGYKKVLSAFKFKYGIKFEDLHDDEGEYKQGVDISNDYARALKNMGIEVTYKGDSRKGEPGVQDLKSDDETANQKSGEPLNRSSAFSWENITDDAEERRFNAFDWSYYPEKIRSYVAKEMKSRSKLSYVDKPSFQASLDNVLKKVLDGKLDINPEDLGKPMDRLAKAAGVEDMEGDSSNSIASSTNWSNLADFLKIERGVNDQGVNLLKKVYDQYDGNHEWRPEPDPDACCMPRWASAVKAANAYIKKNYNVSAGNYFRKNADGSDGDDVSGMYSNNRDKSDYEPSNDETLNSDDYEKARSNYFMFNSMMEMGMQNYLNRNHVNSLVAFLNNKDNDEEFKKNTLNTIRSNYVNGNGAFETFQDALATTRRNTAGNNFDRDYEATLRDSVFNKLTKLPLQEQLHTLEQIKKDKVTHVYENLGQLPNNNKANLLNKLLSKPLLASDLQGQFMAYWALPVPQMISDFRSKRASGGSDTCLRSVLRYYIDQKLDPRIKKQIMKESKEDVIQKIEDLPDDDQTNKIVSYIEQLLDDMGVGGRLQSLTTQLELIDDKEVKRDQLKIAKIIASIDMTPLERAQLFASWKADTLIDTQKLLSGGNYAFSEVFKSYGTEDYMTEFVDDLSDVSNYGVGAGEFLLGVLSKKIQGIGATGGEGDLIVDGINVEVKTKTKKNARFVDDNVRPDQTWASKTEGFKNDFADIEEVANMTTSGINQGQLIQMLQNPKLIQDPARLQKALRSLEGIIGAIMNGLSAQQVRQIIKVAKSGDVAQFKQTYGAYNILNYLNIKRSKGDLDGILFVDKQTKLLSYVRNLEDISENFIVDINTFYVVSSVLRNPFPQIGLKPR